VSAHLIVPGKQSSGDVIGLFQKPIQLSKPASVVRMKGGDRLLGMLGIIVVTAILGLSIYFVVRYLL
jgi:hypothetical protein